MINSKKGDISFIVVVILVIISFFVVSGAIFLIMDKASAKETEIMCKNSVELRARTQINIKGEIISSEIKPIPVLCKTIERKISGTREEIMEQIAYSMARCWWMFGEGRYDEITSGSNVDLFPKVFGFEELNNECFNCYTLLIDQDEIEGGPISPDEVIKFMSNRNHHQYQNLTYLEYIQSYGGPGMAVFTAPVIMPREAYSVSFTPKNKEGNSIWDEVVKGATSVIIVINGMYCKAGMIVNCVIATTGASVVVEENNPNRIPSSSEIMGLASGGSRTYLAGEGVYDLLEKIYQERKISVINVGYLEAGQKFCSSGEISGD